MSARLRRCGFTLVELLVSLAIGSLLIIGVVQVYSRGHAAYTVNENVARLQESARFAFAVLEPDIELAGYYGYTSTADAIRFVSGTEPGIVHALAAQLRQPAATAVSLPLAQLPASAHQCGSNFAVDVLVPVQGADDHYALGPARTGCNPYGAGAVPGADTLTIRRVGTAGAAPEAGRLQLYVSRLHSQSAQLLFADGHAPGPLDDDHDVRDLVVRAYYLSRDSVERPGFPALRVKSLTTVSGSAQFVDSEVMPGIEDFQVEFGIDTGDYDGDGLADADADADAGTDRGGAIAAGASGRTTRYVSPDFADLARCQIVAVRVWLRVRADRPEPGFIDDRIYGYAGVDYTPSAGAAHYRRLLLSRTITLRNARPR